MDVEGWPGAFGAYRLSGYRDRHHFLAGEI